MKLGANLFRALLAVLIGGLVIFLSQPRPPSPPSPVLQTKAPHHLDRGPLGRNEIALTFDADAGSAGIRELLEALADGKVRATFFLTGRWADAYPDWATAISSQGHDIGNHSWGHKNSSAQENWEIREEILRVEDRFTMRFGPRYHRLFRLPYPADADRLCDLVKNTGYHMVGWTLDSLDGTPPEKTSTYISERILHHANEDLDGAIVRLSVGHEATAAAMPAIIRHLRDRGFTFVSLADWVDLPETDTAATRPQ